MPKGKTSRPSNRKTKDAIKKYGRKSIAGTAEVGAEEARRAIRKRGATTKNKNLRENLKQRESTRKTLGKSIAKQVLREGAQRKLLRATRGKQ